MTAVWILLFVCTSSLPSCSHALTGLMFCGFPAHILAAGDRTAWLGM